MGPSYGMTAAADLGADVIKVEPAPDGDNTRAGSPGRRSPFFPTFNRNKRSLCVDLKSRKAFRWC